MNISAIIDTSTAAATAESVRFIRRFNHRAPCAVKRAGILGHDLLPPSRPAIATVTCARRFSKLASDGELDLESWRNSAGNA